MLLGPVHGACKAIGQAAKPTLVQIGWGLTSYEVQLEKASRLIWPQLGVLAALLLFLLPTAPTADALARLAADSAVTAAATATATPATASTAAAMSHALCRCFTAGCFCAACHQASSSDLLVAGSSSLAVSTSNACMLDEEGGSPVAHLVRLVHYFPPTLVRLCAYVLQCVSA